MAYVADPNNPGWLLLEGADPSQESSWWPIPEGFIADPANPGWYFREGSDVSQPENWVHDPSIADLEAEAIEATEAERADVGEEYVPFVEYVPGRVAGAFATQPQGVILHGSRSGSGNDTEAEYRGTVGYVSRGTDGTVGWHATIADDAYAVHMEPTQWGWNARAASQRFLAVEFAQATADRPISDAQVNAFCHWLMTVAVPTWPNLPMHFPTHAEVEAQGLTGARDGKTDCFPNGDWRADELRARIMARLGFEPEPPQDAGGELTSEPDHQFTFEELWPVIERYGNQYGFDPQIIAGILYQEGGWKNWHLHRDGTGFGVAGIDDNGLMQDFERWSGLSVGRGANHAAVSPETQIEFVAYQLARYYQHYGDEGDGPYVAARAWHAGGNGRGTERGQNYARLIQSHVRTLFGG